LDFLINDPTFGIVDTIDSFVSSIWTDRYTSFGDFQLVTLPTQKMLANLAVNNYVCLKDSEHMMIIENREIITDPTNGARLKITGRSLEILLDRRIAWAQTILNGNFQTEIKRLLSENILTTGSADPARKINLIFEDSTDPAITGLTISAQYYGESLYSIVQEQCSAQNIGFKITLNSSNQFVFKLYKGVDRSYAQSTNNYVEFSPNFDNLISSDYVETATNLRNVILVLGEGQGSAIKWAAAGIGTTNDRTGMNRREISATANDLSQTIPTGTLALQQYLDELVTRGTNLLLETLKNYTFSGVVNAKSMYTYGLHFFMGDIVQIENEYGLTGTSRITEYIYSQDESGISSIPTFTKL